MTEETNLEEILEKWKNVINGSVNESAEAGYQHGLQRAYEDIIRAIED